MKGDIMTKVNDRYYVHTIDKVLELTAELYPKDIETFYVDYKKEIATLDTALNRFYCVDSEVDDLNTLIEEIDSYLKFHSNHNCNYNDLVSTVEEESYENFIGDYY